jgi:hypothetical protein
MLPRPNMIPFVICAHSSFSCAFLVNSSASAPGPGQYQTTPLSPGRAALITTPTSLPPASNASVPGVGNTNVSTDSFFFCNLFAQID